MKKRKLRAELAAAEQRIDSLVQRIVTEGGQRNAERTRHTEEKTELLGRLADAMEEKTATAQALGEMASRVAELERERRKEERQRVKAETRLGAAALGSAWRTCDPDWQSDAKKDLPS